MVQVTVKGTIVITVASALCLACPCIHTHQLSVSPNEKAKLSSKLGDFSGFGFSLGLGGLGV